MFSSRYSVLMIKHVIHITRQSEATCMVLDHSLRSERQQISNENTTYSRMRSSVNVTLQSGTLIMFYRRAFGKLRYDLLSIRQESLKSFFKSLTDPESILSKGLRYKVWRKLQIHHYWPKAGNIYDQPVFGFYCNKISLSAFWTLLTTHDFSAITRRKLWNLGQTITLYMPNLLLGT